MRVLVTGAGGFLGGHICQQLGQSGHTIAAVGRFVGDAALAGRLQGLELLSGMTLPDPAFKRTVKAFHPDLVVHAAGTAQVADSVRRPYLDFQRSVDVCAYVLDVLHHCAPASHFVLLSSASLYGNPQTLPVSESARCAPLSPYGYHKWLCELVVEEYRSLFAMRASVLRIFSAYGRGLRRQVIFDLCEKMINAKGPVQVFGSGRESRDFVHAADVAKAVACVAGGPGGIYNVGSGIETTVADLVRMLADQLHCDKEIVFTNEQLPGYPINWRADISHLAALGYRPTVSLRQGLTDYCRWVQPVCASAA